MVSILLLAAAAHVCHVPRAAYQVSGMTPREFMLTAADQRALERYTMCVCGPEGANDAPEVPDAHGRYVYDPRWACERSGWNGRRYIAAPLRLRPPESFFCDDRYRETLPQCVQRVRAYYCSEKSRSDRWPSDDRVAQLYAQTIRDECGHFQP